LLLIRHCHADHHPIFLVRLAGREVATIDFAPAARVMAAMMQVVKFDLKKLKHAANRK
jgi:hypothetical protein